MIKRKVKVMNTMFYVEYLSDSAKSSYVLQSKDFISTKDFFKSLQEEIIKHTDHKSDGHWIVDNFFNNKKAPWNIKSQKEHDYFLQEK